jgi:flagellar export protein FliJ
MTFRFPLQPALDAAAARERAAEAASAAARAALAEARRASCALAERAGEARSLRTSLGASPSKAAAWLAIEEYGARLDRRRVALACTAALADAGVRSALERLAARRRQRLALERLRERRLAEHRALVALREAAEFDESNAASAAFAAGGR